MASLPVVADVIRVRLGWFTGADSAAISNLYFGYTGGPPSNANCVTMAGTIIADAATALEGAMGATTGMEYVEVTDLGSTSGGQGENTTAFGGTRSGHPVPAGAAVLVNYQIPRRYRGGKPRTYWPAGVAEDLATSKQWLSASVTAFESAWSTFLTDILAAGAGIVIAHQVNVSYYDGYTWETYGTPVKYRRVLTLRATPVTDNVTSSSVSPTVGSQRRRNKDT